MFPIIKSWFYFWRFIVISFNNDGCFYRAAALTLTSLLSIVPLLAVSFSILAAFPKFKPFGTEIQIFIFQNFIATSGHIILKYLQEFALHAAQLSVISLMFLLITAVLMLYNIEQALNVIWRVKVPRHGISAFLLYWAILTLTPIFIGLGFAASSYFFSLPFISSAVTFLGITKLFLIVTPFLLSAIAFSLLYILVPNCNIRFSCGLAGGIVAAILFELAKHGFGLYIAMFPTYELLYGALAAIPIFLIWIYLSWLVILFGAEVSHALMFNQNNYDELPLDNFSRAFYWLGYLWQAQKVGTGLTLYEMSSRDKRSYEVVPQELLAQLISAHLIQTTNEGKYILCRDLNTFSLAQLYEILPWKLPSIDTVTATEDPWLKSLATVLKGTEVVITQKLNIPLSDLYISHQ